MDGETDILGQIGGLGSVGGGEPRRSEYTGAKALMMAVLEDGIRDYCDATGRRGIEAKEWVQSHRRDAFSFIAICETLGLEPAAVRQALVRLRNRPAQVSRRLGEDVSKATSGGDVAIRRSPLVQERGRGSAARARQR